MSEPVVIGRNLPARRAQAIATREIAYILFRRRWVALAVALPIMLVASLGLFKKTNAFIASSRVLMDLRSPSSPQWNSNISTPDYDRYLSTYQNLAMSFPVAVSAAGLLADSVRVFAGAHPEFGHLTKQGNLIDFITRHLDVVQVGESNILALRFATSDQQLSLMADRACRDAFVDYSVSAGRNVGAIAYYDEQSQSVRSGIDSLLERRSQILQESGYSSFDDDQRYNSGLMSNLKDKANEALVARRTIEGRLAYHRQMMAADPDYCPLGERGMEDQPVMAAKYKFDEYRDKLSQATVYYPAGTVEVRRLEDLVEQARTVLRSSIEAYFSAFEAEARALAEKERALREQIDSLSAILRQSPDVYRRVSLIDADIVARQALLKDMQVKAGEVRISSMADERISRIVKLTEPEIDKVISGSRKLAYFGLISIFGLFLGIVVAFVVDQQDHRIYTRRSIEDRLDIPVLGLITSVRPGDGA
jgi:polysaccharide biosynthesis transport protein